MVTFTLRDVENPGVGGIFIESRVSQDVSFFLPNSRGVRNAIFTVDGLEYEILGVEYGPLILVDHSSESYALVAPHHYCFEILKKNNLFFVLANREVIKCNAKKMCSWEIGIQDWFDLEDETTGQDTDALDYAKNHFLKGKACEDSELSYQLLVKL